MIEGLNEVLTLGRTVLGVYMTYAAVRGFLRAEHAYRRWRQSPDDADIALLARLYRIDEAIRATVYPLFVALGLTALWGAAHGYVINGVTIAGGLELLALQVGLVVLSERSRRRRRTYAGRLQD